MTEKLQDQLALLAAKLGTTAENLLQLYRKQLPICALDDLVGVLVGLAIAYGCFRLIKHWLADEDFINEWGQFPACLPSIGIVFGLMLAWIGAYWLLTLFLNPDYYVWNMILRQLK